MWVIRFLSGPMAGQTRPLHPGRNVMGRSPSCQIPLLSSGASKEHLEILVGDQITITDLRSSNGTFVNGIGIRQRILQTMDKVSVADTLFDIVWHANPRAELGVAPPHRVVTPPPSYQHHLDARAHLPPPGMSPPQMPHGMNNDAVFTAQPPMGPAPTGYGVSPGAPDAATPGASAANLTPPNLVAKLQNYMNTVALPGVYKLAEATEVRWVWAGFVCAFVILLTALSMIPMIQITKDSIEKESRRRALTIARNLARVNETALSQGVESSVTTREAQLEEGVDSAMVISHVDGHIISPPNLAGSYADKPFIHSARRESKEVVTQIDDSLIGAAVPIAFYNSTAGAYQVAAHAVVLYNMGALALDDGRTISLFVQTLFLALLLGGVLYYLTYKLFEHPVEHLNQKLDQALKDRLDQVTTPYAFPPLQSLAQNISSALSRTLNGANMDLSGPSPAVSDLPQEIENLLRIVGLPALAVRTEDMTILTTNSFLENLLGINGSGLRGQNLEAFPDQALQLNLKDLVERVKQQPHLIASNVLDFGGENFELNAQMLMGHSAQQGCCIITVQPAYAESAGEVA